VTAPRIAVSGVVRSWEGADRTGINAAYVRSVIAAGGVPLVVSPLVGPSLAGRALDGVEGLLLSGGEDMHPAWYGQSPSPYLNPPSRERDLSELALFAVARERGMPILGICRGIQLINVALGGTLYQDLPSERPDALGHDSGGARDARSHPVRLAAGSRAARVLGTTELSVNSFHHQAVARLADGLIASGWTEDGVIEAVESPGEAPWLLAVQWHPEEMHADAVAPEGGLFRALIEAATHWADPSARLAPDRRVAEPVAGGPRRDEG
jgi:putative glutamine amidotransferase